MYLYHTVLFFCNLIFIIAELQIETLISGLGLCEAPYWDADKQCLYFVDNFGTNRTINKYDYQTIKLTFAVIGPEGASFLMPIKDKDNQFIVSLFKKLAIVEWDGESNQFTILKTIVEVPYRFNDGKVDPVGRLWAGTQNVEADIHTVQPVVSLYSLDGNLALRTQLEGIYIANGLEWNSNIGKFYYIDSMKFGIDQYDYDNTTGRISNGEQLFSVRPFNFISNSHNLPGWPDGIAIDTDGNLWVTIYNGDRIIKIDGHRNDALLDTIEIPNTASLAFGGPNLDELFVTTGDVPNNKKYGQVYRIRGLSVRGVKMNKFVLN